MGLNITHAKITLAKPQYLSTTSSGRDGLLQLLKLQSARLARLPRRQQRLRAERAWSAGPHPPPWKQGWQAEGRAPRDARVLGGARGAPRGRRLWVFLLWLLLLSSEGGGASLLEIQESFRDILVFLLEHLDVVRLLSRLGVSIPVDNRDHLAQRKLKGKVGPHAVC